MKCAVMFGAVALVLLAIVSTGSARPEGASVESTSASAVTSTSTVSGVEDGATTTAVPEESKMSKFFDDVSSAFKSGTAKVKESFESAATSVKDGVLRGYGFVKDKLTGTASEDATAAPGNETVTTSASVAVTPTTKLVSARSITGTSATAKAISVEPNDEETKDEDKLIFIGDEDTATDSAVPVTTTVPPVVAAGSSTNKTKLDDRWIIDGPTACKSGQTVVNGKCRNTF